jgi:hypothetical protein
MTDAAIQPIETIYRGYRFRSRLEARWAVFLDAARIVWEYEAQGFDLGGARYLPDFWLPKDRQFLEIKPLLAHADWLRLRQEYQPKLALLANQTGREVFVLEGSPCPEDPWDVFMDERSDVLPRVVACAPDRGWCSARLFECAHCGRVAFRRFEYGAWDMWCECQGGHERPFKDENYDPYELSPRIRRAMLKARQARFEHDERENW